MNFLRKMLKKKIGISVGGVLLICLITVFAITASAATARYVQALLSPDITFTFRGEVQTLRDINGNIVHPLVYNGTTYLPVRAIAELVGEPVDWDAATRTVHLGVVPAGGRLLRDVATQVRFQHTARWNWINDPAILNDPQYRLLDDFGNQIPTDYSLALIFDRTYSSHATFDLPAGLNILTFDLFNQHERTARTVRVRNMANDTVISTLTVESGQLISSGDINIAGMTQIRIETTGNVRLLDLRVR